METTNPLLTPDQALTQNLAKLTNLKEQGGLEPLIEQLRDSLDREQFAKLFQTDGRIACIDDRILGAGERVAGSTALLTDLEREQYIQAIQDAGLTPQMTWHKNCGAMALKYRQMHHLTPEAPLSPEEVDQSAELFAAEMAEKFHIPLWGEIKQDGPEWRGPLDWHPSSSVAISVGNPRQTLQAGLIDALPQAFSIKTNDFELALRDLDLALAIMRGGHGLGRPLLDGPGQRIGVFLMTETQSQLNQYLDILHKRLPDPEIWIDGLVATSEASL